MFISKNIFIAVIGNISIFIKSSTSMYPESYSHFGLLIVTLFTSSIFGEHGKLILVSLLGAFCFLVLMFSMRL